MTLASTDGDSKDCLGSQNSAIFAYIHLSIFPGIPKTAGIEQGLLMLKREKTMTPGQQIKNQNGKRPQPVLAEAVGIEQSYLLVTPS